MKYSFVACIMLCFSMASAQLTVRNSAYVYVTDQVLFVTDDVNLQEANTKLYLRDDAQLLQDPLSTTSQNRGFGELSVYQNSEVNQFSYHYWCSPVGGVLINNTNNNVFRINQLDDALTATPNPIDSNDSMFTSGLNGTASPSLTISTNWLWTYVTSSTYADWVYVGDTGDVNPGLGFTMKGLGAFGATINQDFDFRGKPNNGTIINPIAAGQLTLIGNPYPSALDAADFLWDAQNVNLDEQDAPIVGGTTGAIYYWEQDPANSDSHNLDQYVGGYASYTCTMPDGSDNIMESFAPAPYLTYYADGTQTPLPPTGPGTRTARRYIPIGQGFMVEGAPGIPASSNVYIKNSHRDYVKESAANSEFFRSANPNNVSSNEQYNEYGYFIVPEDYMRFRLMLSFDDTLYSRELLANFHNSATDGFDRGLEAKMPNTVASDAYWTHNGEPYVIQAHSFSTELRIPLVVKVDAPQAIDFGIYDIQNFDDTQGIYVYDADNDIYVDLRAQNYNINVESGDYSNRFEIVFTPSQALDIDNFEVSNLTINQNNAVHQLWILNPNSIGVKSIEVYDVAGKRMLHSQYDSVLNRYELSTVDLSDGVYVVNVMSNDNAVKSQKIIIKN